MSEQDLFSHAAALDMTGKPLAEKMRPRSLEEIVGQEKLLGPKQALRQLIARGALPSMILWGPPGTGKTTLARLLAQNIQCEFESLSAVLGGVKELRAAMDRASERRRLYRKRTLLFIDEIHRFNKAQQDALLPQVESGLVTLVGATTENPSFEVNAALLSRCRVFALQPVDAQALQDLLIRALNDRDRGLGRLKLSCAPEALAAMCAHAAGDARRALTTLDVAAQLCHQGGREMVGMNDVEQASQTKTLLYDKGGDEHYHVVSAFIKSMRGSDPDAALYYMVRMLEAGETPRFILRRMAIFASEDIGNSDPQALQVATGALQAFELVGLPEGVLPMTQAAIYLACAPKSNAVLSAYGEARRAVREHGALPVPLKLRNAPTAGMRQLDYGKEYKYPHQFDGHYVCERYLPDALQGEVFYRPSDQGHETEIAARLTRWREGNKP